MIGIFTGLVLNCTKNIGHGIEYWLMFAVYITYNFDFCIGLWGMGRPPKWTRVEVGFTLLKVE